jgi:hypothetical protein
VVEAEGGEVLLVDLMPGHSTTSIVQRSGKPEERGAKPSRKSAQKVPKAPTTV